MKATHILPILAVIVTGVLGFIIGYQTAPERQGQLDDVKFRITFGNRLYRALEAGDTNKALSEVRFVLWNDTTTYQRRYGAPSATDRFAGRFAEAKLITAGVEADLRQNRQKFKHAIESLVKSNSVAPKR